MFKRKKSDLSTPAYIVSTNGNQMVVELKKDRTNYKAGQTVVAIVSKKENTLGGRPVIVSDVVAQGLIADINGNCITIRSNKNNPIVSQRAAVEAKRHATEILVRAVQ